MDPKRAELLARVGLAALICGGSQVLAATALDLVTSEAFAILDGTEVMNAGSSAVDGDVGVSPGNVIFGFLPGTVTGTTYAADAVAAQAKSDLTTTYDDLVLPYLLSLIPHSIWKPR